MRKSKNIKPLLKFSIILSLSICVLDGIGGTILVTSETSSIQEALNSAVSGDTILVAPGTYTENICFYGKNVVLTSRYLIDDDYNIIFSTIIDGSNPEYSDSASVVRFMHGEDSTAIIEGFTITGGTGTLHPDTEPNLIWREGGGVLAYFANPTVKNNYITKNVSNDATGISGAGGGGVSFFKSDNAYLTNNVISYNEGGDYAAGVCIDQAGATIKNNIIGRNFGGVTYGGGGIWVLKPSSNPTIVENNTVVRNESPKNFAGLMTSNSTVIARNNIFWQNKSAKQVGKDFGSFTISYSIIEGGYSAGTNISIDDPLFVDEKLSLQETSPAIDAGNPETIYNDIEDTENSGSALLPSKGTTRNDLGAFGGSNPIQFSADIDSLDIPQTTSIFQQDLKKNKLRVLSQNSVNQTVIQYENLKEETLLSIYNLSGQLQKSVKISSNHGQVVFENGQLKKGYYLAQLKSAIYFETQPFSIY